jgi:secreted PhoX family phosphatase
MSCAPRTRSKSTSGEKGRSRLERRETATSSVPTCGGFRFIATEKKNINNVDGTTSKDVETFVGASPGETDIAETPDSKALFVNIQHSGEETAPVFGNPASFGSHWPDGGNARPRSATVVITRNDGGTVGGGSA